MQSLSGDQLGIPKIPKSHNSLFLLICPKGGTRVYELLDGFYWSQRGNTIVGENGLDYLGAGFDDGSMCKLTYLALILNKEMCVQYKFSKSIVLLLTSFRSYVIERGWLHSCTGFCLSR